MVRTRTGEAVMPPSSAVSRALSHRDVIVALVCWLVVMGVLAALPLLAEDVAPSARPGTPGWWACAATFTAQSAVLVWARRAPRTALVLIAALPLPLASAGIGDVFSLASAAVMAAVFLTALALPLRHQLPALVAAAVFVAAGEMVNTAARVGLEVGGVVSGVLQAIAAVGAPLLLATAITGRREARTAHEHELEAKEREQDALVRAAVADERTAMARELHDIAAHHMSGIALMAAAVDRQIDTDPATAKRSVRQIRTQSTTVLEDLRRLVGLLREDAEATRSVQSLEAIAELVDLRRTSGADVVLVMLRADHGTALGAGVGPLAQLALYRIVQESLANAARHAPGASVVVEIDDRDDEIVTVSVTNRPGARVVGGQTGFGLIGMRERAELLGATLEYGHTPEGGWRVRVELPRDADHRQEETT